MKKGVVFFLMLCFLSSALLGCDSNSSVISPTEKVRVVEKTPELAGAEDSLRLRNKKLTDYWTTNESPILYNFYNLYNCEIVKVEGDEYPYKMFIFGETTSDDSNVNKGYDSIFHARGKSLTEWEVWCGNNKWDTSMTPSLWEPIMVRADKTFDSIHNGDPSVVYKDGVYYMAFSSVGFDGREPGITYIVNCIMGATSVDGINWIKSEDPIMIWEREYIDGWIAGDPCPPSTGGYHRPSIIWDEEENKWKMWFDYYLPGTFLSMGYAVNNGDFMDPQDWQLIHAEETPHLRDWPNPEVVKINGKYYAFSDVPGFGSSRGGPQNDRQIVMAVSDNGWDWRVVGKMLPEDKKYGTHLPQTYVDTENGEEYLYVFYSMVVQEDLPKYSKTNFMKIPVKTLEDIVTQ